MMKHFRTFHAAFLAAVAMLIVAWSASGQDTAKKGPLAEMPSKPGPHHETVDAIIAALATANAEEAAR